MTLKATTPHPAEVAKHFSDFADILEIYASDNAALNARWATGKRERSIRIELYRSIANEMRSIVFEEGPLE